MAMSVLRELVIIIIRSCIGSETRIALIIASCSALYIPYSAHLTFSSFFSPSL
jgi:hypothetical protein